MAYGKVGRPRTYGWLSVYAAAKRLGVSYYQFMQGVATGDIPAQKFGSRYLIQAVRVEDALKRGTFKDT